MKRFVIDTCSLIALHYSGYLEAAVKTVNLVTTKKIYSELEEMGKFSDDDSSAAREVLKFMPGITVLMRNQNPPAKKNWSKPLSSINAILLFLTTSAPFLNSRRLTFR